MFGCCCANPPDEAVIGLQIYNLTPHTTYNTDLLDEYDFEPFIEGFVGFWFWNLDVDPASKFGAYDGLAPYKAAYAGFGFLNKGGGYFSSGGTTYVAGRALCKWSTLTDYPNGCVLSYGSQLRGDFVGQPLQVPGGYEDGVTGIHTPTEPDMVPIGDPDEVAAQVFIFDSNYADLTFPLDWNSIFWFS